MSLELVRNADHADLLASLDLMSESLGFSFDPRFTPEKFLEFEGPQNFRLMIDRAGKARRGVVGVLSVQRAGQFFGGVSHPMGALRCVGVAPEHRGRGVLRTMLDDSLREQRDAGLTISSLYPSSPRTYRSFGYEHSGANFVRRHSLAALGDVGPAKLAIEPVAHDEIDALSPVYRRAALESNGWIDRGHWWWSRALLKPFSSKQPRLYRFVRKEENAIEGYASFIQHGDHHPLRLHVAELVCASADAMQSALSLLHAHRSMFEMLSWLSGPVDWLAPFFDVPVGDVEEEGAPLPHPINPWMTRVLSLRPWLEAWRYPRGLSLELHLAVRDALFAENSGSFRVRVEAGVAKVEPGGRGSVQVDVRALAALMGSHATVATLVHRGLLSGDRDELADLAGAFAGIPAWTWDSF